MGNTRASRWGLAIAATYWLGASLTEIAYYVPTLPCVTDFSSIPALEIPQSDTLVGLQATVGDLIRQGGNVVCDHQAYYFDNVPPPPMKTFLPVTIR